ncbi:unnamed protein product [Adineta steineri]|uniref:FLYWCH-type domain-containing protein n=1 Tax=Adineta steineri TaxID=433720 RepID=A0A819VYA1_9BILA|nr:unnamed protein product [Adineta steineri]CAF4115906.1 unnamed protein product [Adineta steineri]
MAETLKSEPDTIQLIPPVISFIISQKKKPMLIMDDYLFKSNKGTTSTKYWICTFSGCPAKIHTTLNDVVEEIVNEHNHPPEKEKIEVRKFRAKVKERAMKETTPIPQIYEEECARMMLSFAAIAILLSEREMSSSVNKARRLITPQIPTTQLFDIPEPFNKTLRNSEFVIVDKMIARRQRILLFASKEQLKMLFNANTILMDGTFSSCPTMFDQVYTIHSIKFDQCEYLASMLIISIHSSIFFIAFPCVFASYSSCYFHLTQAIYRAIQRFGLSTHYNNDDDVKHVCRQLMAMALLPATIIENTYNQLLVTMTTHIKNTLKDLLKYFEEQWFEKVPIQQWCVYGLSIRANNNAETFYSRFNQRVQVHHPNIWSFIKVLQGEENRFEHMRIQFYAGLGPRAKQSKTIAIQRRINNLNMRYDDGLITPNGIFRWIIICCC